MSRRRALTDEQCAELARWWTGSREPLTAKAETLGVSLGTLRDAIKRGRNQPTDYMRRKVESYLAELSTVPRETDKDSQITAETA